MRRYNGVEYRKIRFKVLFRLTQREKTKNGIVVRLWLKKWLRTLEKWLLLFFNLKIIKNLEVTRVNLVSLLKIYVKQVIYNYETVTFLRVRRV